MAFFFGDVFAGSATGLASPTCCTPANVESCDSSWLILLARFAACSVEVLLGTPFAPLALPVVVVVVADDSILSNCWPKSEI